MTASDVILAIFPLVFLLLALASTRSQYGEAPEDMNVMLHYEVRRERERQEAVRARKREQLRSRYIAAAFVQLLISALLWYLGREVISPTVLATISGLSFVVLLVGCLLTRGVTLSPPTEESVVAATRTTSVEQPPRPTAHATATPPPRSTAHATATPPPTATQARTAVGLDEAVPKRTFSDIIDPIVAKLPLPKFSEATTLGQFYITLFLIHFLDLLVISFLLATPLGSLLSIANIAFLWRITVRCHKRYAEKRFASGRSKLFSFTEKCSAVFMAYFLIIFLPSAFFVSAIFVTFFLSFFGFLFSI